MKYSAYLLWAAVLTVAPGVVRTQGLGGAVDEIEWFPVDTAPGYVERVKAVIKKAQQKHLPVYLQSDGITPAMRVDNKPLDSLDLSVVERYGRAPANDSWSPEMRHGSVLLLTNVIRVRKMIRTATEKHMAVVVDGKVADTNTVAALNPSRIAHATLYEKGDGAAVDAYGPEVKDGFLFLTTRTHQ